MKTNIAPVEMPSLIPHLKQAEVAKRNITVGDDSDDDDFGIKKNSVST